jgi:predicted DNA-binding antitoxin AbrB/MazE fold protein
MYAFVFEATFEDGVLKPDRHLPLAEHQRIKVSVDLPTPDGPSIDSDVDFIRETSGILGWTGDAEIVERIALDPGLGIHESP